jgi:hypothetical protein
MDPETDKMVNTEFIEGFTTLGLSIPQEGKILLPLIL